MEKEIDDFASDLQKQVNADAENMYSKKVICYANNPENVGRMNDPDGSAFTKGLCGDTMEIYLSITDGRIVDARFFTDGCGVTLACGTSVTKLIKGKTIAEVFAISPAHVIIDLDGLPGENLHCSILAVNTLHKAVADYLLRNGQ